MRKTMFGLAAFVACVAGAYPVIGDSAAAKNIEWEFPREGCCHEGMAFADGVTGVLVWGGGSTVKITVARGDLWDHRGGYPWTGEQSYTNIVAAVQAGDKARLLRLFDKKTSPGEPRNPYMLPLGRVVVEVPGAELKKGELDPKTGLGALYFEKDGRMLIASLAMSKPSRAFAIKFPDGADFSVKTLSAMQFPVSCRKLSRVGFSMPSHWRGSGSTGCNWSGGFLWNLPADSPVSLAWCRCGAELEIRTARGGKASTDSVGYARIRDESVAYWKAFWERSAKVSVPDETIQRVFDYGMYRFGAMTDPDGVPAGLQGPWLEDDDLVPWNGDYHFNINVQECYSPAYRGGHFENLKPLFAMIRRWWPRLRDNAKKFCGIDDGFVLPHSVDDRGVCIGGFWSGTIDHASTAWVAAMMYRYVRYSGDVEFLKSDAYPFMKGAMNVYLAMFEECNGRLSLPIGPSPEWGGSDVRKSVGRDPSFQLAAAHRLAADLVDAAARLGEKPDWRWLDVIARLPRYTVGQGGIQLFENQQLVESHRHHSHMAGFYPFDTIDVTAPENRSIVESTYATWIGCGTGLWSGWCVPWASILHTHAGNADAAVMLLKSWDVYFTNPGHASCHDAQKPGFSEMRGRKVMQMDGMCAAVTAIMELMVHDTYGKTEYFKGCPESWKNVSFENIRLADGTCVSGVRENGKVQIFKK